MIGDYQIIFPKIIHQIWFQGKNIIPSKYIPKINKIKEFHPSWKYIVWDDKSIKELMMVNKNWLDTYHHFRYLHQKVDFAKYVILYQIGGVYLDMDVEILKPLDMLLHKNNEFNIIVSRINLNSFESLLCCGRKICINNGIIISKPGESVLEKIINHIIQMPVCSKWSTKYICINYTTGPNMFSKLILDNIHDKIKILEPEYLEPMILGIGEITDNTYTVHEHDGTWYSSIFKNIGIFYLRHKLLTLLMILLPIIIIIYILIIN